MYIQIHIHLYILNTPGILHVKKESLGNKHYFFPDIIDLIMLQSGYKANLKSCAKTLSKKVQTQFLKKGKEMFTHTMYQM